MGESITIHSDQGGISQQITITKTGSDKAEISLQSDDGGGQDENVKQVRADPATLTLTCKLDAFLMSADISVVVARAGEGGQPYATITITHALVGNGVHVFPLRAGEDEAVDTFLRRAAFPPLSGS